jgi:hypothetical protein
MVRSTTDNPIKRTIFTLAFYLCMAILFLFMPAMQPVGACTPTEAPMEGTIIPTEIPWEIQIAKESQDALVVVEGTILDFTTENDAAIINHVTFQVDQYDKGHGPQTILLSGRFYLDCPMVPPFDKGSHLIFLLRGQPTISQSIEVMDWFPVEADAVVAVVRNSVGQTPHAPDATPTIMAGIMSTTQNGSNLSLLIFLTLIILVIILLAWSLARVVKYLRKHP